MSAIKNPAAGSTDSQNIIQTVDRNKLISSFRNGVIPTEDDYKLLIESMINKQDDGFSKDDRNGFVIRAGKDSGRFFSFFRKANDPSPFFILEKDDDGGSLRLISGERSADEKKKAEKETKDGKAKQTGFHFHTNGALDLGEERDNGCMLNVQGIAGMQGRMGLYNLNTEGKGARLSTIPADGKWHAIIESLNNCNAFEVVARVGQINSGRFAIVHATVVRAYGRGRGGIRRTGSHFGPFWNRIRLRWTHQGDYNYSLEMKTCSNYGEGVNISYHITQLWNDRIFLDESNYH